MSTSEEIAEVYASDIARQTNIVLGRKGIMPFLRGFDGMYVFDMYKEAFFRRDVIDAIQECQPTEKILRNGRKQGNF